MGGSSDVYGIFILGNSSLGLMIALSSLELSMATAQETPMRYRGSRVITKERSTGEPGQAAS